MADIRGSSAGHQVKRLYAIYPLVMVVWTLATNYWEPELFAHTREGWKVYAAGLFVIAALIVAAFGVHVGILWRRTKALTQRFPAKAVVWLSLLQIFIFLIVSDIARYVVASFLLSLVLAPRPGGV